MYIFVVYRLDLAVRIVRLGRKFLLLNFVYPTLFNIPSLFSSSPVDLFFMILNFLMVARLI